MGVGYTPVCHIEAFQNGRPLTDGNTGEELEDIVFFVTHKCLINSFSNEVKNA